MTLTDWQCIEKLFHAALEQPAESREAWLFSQDAAPAVIAEVRSLLDSLRAQDTLDGSDGQAAASPVSDFTPAVPSERFGAYRLIRLLGRGGMSAVYLGERDDGHHERKVAVKILAAHLATEDFLRRFRAEGNVLASLQHRNIATLLDGGISESGQPYLVLELIEGERLDEYCDSRKLPVADRLRLFVQVCEAVDYAHRSLILHRDLKPANVLVTADGVAKLLDFGTASLLGAAPQVTATRTRMLTPRYASPEQLRGERPGVASDVFSLGVILYELLTGSWPFGDSESVMSELRRAAGDLAPAPPPSAITEAAAALRSQSRDRLRRTLAGDLSAIVLKALESQPTARYLTAGALAADLGRFLQGRPVEARTHAVWYRPRKFLRRHWVPVSAVLIFVVGLALSAAIALRQAHAARTESLRSQDLNRFLDGMLASASQYAFDPKKYTVAEMLDSASQRLERSSGKDTLTAYMHTSLAKSYVALLRFDQADLHLARAIPVLEAAGDESQLAVALGLRGMSLTGQAQFPAAIRSFEAALEHLRHLGRRADPLTVFDVKRELANVLGFWTTTQPERARQLWKEAIDLGRSNPAVSRADLASALSYYGGALMDEGKNQEAEAALLEALAAGRTEDPAGHWELNPLFRLEVLHERRRDPAGAKAIALRMIDVATRSVGPEHPDIARVKLLWANDAVQTGEADAAADAVRENMPTIEKTYTGCSPELWRMGSSASHTLRIAGRAAEAERYARESLAATCAWDGKEVRVGEAWQELGEVLRAEKKSVEALKALEQADSIYQNAGDRLKPVHTRIAAEINQLRGSR